jgi:predicted enzyme related to lactoylglutathione lyase
MADKVTWFELPAFDVKRSGEFYKEVFGWDSTDMGGGSLAMISAESDEQMTPLKPGSINGDISPISMGFNAPLIVISVENMDDKIEVVKKAGGIIVVAPKTIEAMGMIWAIVQDTEGNKIGILQNL